MNLSTKVPDVGPYYKKAASRLEKLGIKTVQDFLYHIPSRYEDYSLISKISHIQAGETVTIQGTITAIKNEITKNWKKLQKATIADETGNIDIIWFNQPYLLNVIKKGDTMSVSGKVDWFAHKLVFSSPDYEVLIPGLPTIHTGRLVPVYPETHGITSKWIRRQVYKILSENKEYLQDYLPQYLLGDNTMSFTQAIEQIHFPKTIDNAYKAKQRLAFDELFLLQLAAMQKREAWNKNLKGNPFSITQYQKQIEAFWEKLPFSLTNAQKKALHDIFTDLAKTSPMNRLLEGDVGSGKTVVGAIAMYLAHLNGFQSVLMAPTEILAQQHYATITNLLSPMGIKVGLATGSKKQVAGSKWQVDKNLPHATSHTLRAFDILIGTHAVLSKNINFDKLGLVIIDEQQRFGVEQRSIIRQKGKNPHLLTMTATPIPRTVALTMYGDLDVSYLDEMPKGRKIIKTWLVPEEKRKGAYKWMESQLATFNSQLFIVCPFIEESETMQTVKAAAKEFERLQKKVFPKLSLGLLHGKLKAKEKDAILQQFREGKIHILVATPVVEVGIDIPNATIMVIEAAERFGLSQLHQLRGRVGRGDKQSYCLLFTDATNPITIQRLKAMETTQIGAELAELDLRLRGPGELFGTVQHGNTNLKIASFSDFPLIEKARIEAEKIFPTLKKYPLLAEKLNTIVNANTSPD